MLRQPIVLRQANPAGIPPTANAADYNLMSPRSGSRRAQYDYILRLENQAQAGAASTSNLPILSESPRGAKKDEKRDVVGV